VINAAREGARYAGGSFTLTAQNIADTTEIAAYPLPLDSSTATIIVTRVQIRTTSGVSAILSYTPAYASGLGATQPSRFTANEMLSRYSQGTQINGDDEFVLVEFFYSYPLFIWEANVPMYSYTIMRVTGN
ncbi:MAG: hypothetical protein HY784_01500, partial [Chloroflexi bacterium]|nr:hypothetical protein [Chloroflexota bacterium]